ncbi:hypothetical protein [Bacillus sp. Marseille-P3800]|uniref:hypothetical protein n=1 Tax=Bacillus sp. Marseille-P3800 TaxID=2014782 RepID=UPI000C07069A|nr:hypothetical protein [Bacillus sp. Marseille-P3800]
MRIYRFFNEGDHFTLAIIRSNEKLGDIELEANLNKLDDKTSSYVLWELYEESTIENKYAINHRKEKIEIIRNGNSYESKYYYGEEVLSSVSGIYAETLHDLRETLYEEMGGSPQLEFMINQIKF